MVTSRKKLLNLTAGLIFLTGILPVLLYGFGFIGPAGKLGELPFRESPLYEQWIIVIAAFGVKPTYMLLSLLLIIRLWLIYKKGASYDSIERASYGQAIFRTARRTRFTASACLP